MVIQQSAITENINGSRAAQSCWPKIKYEIAIDQYLSGGFSRYGTPSRCGVTQSPLTIMLRAMVACTASTSSCRCGGLKKQPRKMTTANAITIACSRLVERTATGEDCDAGAVMIGIFKKWWPGTELNRRHADFQSAALPTELPGREGWASTSA